MWLLSLTACASVPAIAPPGTEVDGNSKLLIRLQTDTKGQTNFRLSEDILDGATLTGPAVSTSTGWALTTTGLDWFAYTLPSHKWWGTKPPNYKESIGPWLFPEVYGYSTPPPAKHSVQWGEDIPWNTDYSAASFAENLRPVRDSGTLLRDFEESPELWRLCYVWPSLWATQAPAAALTVKSVFPK
jgi:hypothetical protein